MRRTTAVILASLAAMLLLACAPQGDAVSPPESDWRITNFQITYQIGTDGVVHAHEEIDTVFRSVTKHGIFRDLDYRIPCADVPPESQPPADNPALYKCGEHQSRAYSITNIVAPKVNGVPAEISDNGATKRIRIGDPNATITGAQHYTISYDIGAALDPFTTADQFYWNATGNRWVVPMDKVTVTVQLPETANVVENSCYQGVIGSKSQCKATVAGATVQYVPTRGLGYTEGMTVDLAVPKGIIDVQQPKIVHDFWVGDLFTLDVIEFGGLAVVAILSAGWLVLMWWRHGRDRRYRTIYYLSQDAAEETRPLFASRDVVVEYLPPDDLRPAEMGVILDERADTLDVSATIVDLAVRGFLRIEEIPKHGLFGHKDWRLVKLDGDESQLRGYEIQLYRYLFGSHNEVELSDLKNKFANKLQNIKKMLYGDAKRRGWFNREPESAKVAWLFAGVGVILLGALVSAGTGWFFGRLLIGVPIVLVGIIMVPLSRAMSRRTAVGSEALRRVLGFRLYISTAETQKQEFNEKQNIFAAYLPYAIVFGCVDKWAKAFEGIENEMSNTNWYVGTQGAFSAMALSSAMGGFSSSVSSSIASTPGSSGGSGGGGGGSSGGGGGGGGGGSW